MAKVYELTEEDIYYINNKAEEFKYDIKKLTQGMTGDAKKDGRSAEGIAIKLHLIEQNIKPSVLTNDPKKYKAFQLTKEQKLFVENNAVSMTIAEITSLLFPEITHAKGIAFTKEFKAVKKYINNKMDIVLPEPEKKDKSGLPKNLTEAVELINKSIGSDYHVNNLKDEQKESINKMIRYLRRGSIMYTLDEYRDKSDKDVYLEYFVADVWDKNDLTSGEVTQFADLAAERVRLKQAKRYRRDLQDDYDEIMGKTGKAPFSLIENMTKQDKSIDECQGRISSLIKGLEGTRAQRIKDKPSNEKTILSIIEIFKKKKTRDQFLEMQKKQDELLRDQLDTYENQDEYLSRIFGASKSELISQQ